MQYNLTKPPIIERVSNTQEALARLAEAKFDLVISLMRVEGEALNIVPFINNIRCARTCACARALMRVSNAAQPMAIARVWSQQQAKPAATAATVAYPAAMSSATARYDCSNMVHCDQCDARRYAPASARSAWPSSAAVLRDETCREIAPQVPVLLLALSPQELRTLDPRVDQVRPNAIGRSVSCGHYCVA